ncbi:hypothetical protein E5Q_01496 [Mixia osmundae IAM 14324]|uniref:Vacuolar protein sorting-associated protein n=1 Tax=Mixia osmundae (strain CBS 9802 / IAM 14324 / JCM 22182 / KY 12970) TaxID=764103 RepID=G7DW36_MIXOS|nr:hypothetical protein E5Q_01496 [Mixia osmundae IAM 14324]
MLEGVVAGVLNRTLSAYVDNLDTSQLNLGIWSGDVKLRNLRLKKEALDKFRLPINVTEGYLGELTLNIPWTNLKGKPVRVVIDNVYLLAEPAGETNFDLEEDERRAQQVKMEKLENAELLTTQPSAGMSAEEEQKNQSFVSSLVARILDNLQITVKNIHVRYEDRLSVPGHPFSVGLTLAGFSAVSTDEHWQPTFLHNSDKGIHKLAKLDSLAIYFDTDSTSLGGQSQADAMKTFVSLIATETSTSSHQFILKPVSGAGRLIMNKHMDGQTPKIDAELFFNELGFVLDGDQYRDALSMVDLFHFYTRQHQYRKFRPPEIEFEKSKSRALLRFAGSAILNEVHEKNRVWSWSYFAERRDDRKEYIQLFKLVAKDANDVTAKARIGELERKLGYKDIRFYRSIARSEMRKEQATARKTAEQERLQAGPVNRGWVGWIWGGGKSNGSDDQPQDLLNTQQRKELYAAIDWDEKDAVAASVDLPRDTLQLRLKAKLDTGSFALREDPHGKNTDIISMVFDAFSADVLQRPDSLEAILALGGMRVYDGTQPNTLHPQIVRVKQEKTAIAHRSNSQDKLGTALASVKQESDPDNPFFYVKFEKNPLDERADMGLTVRMRYMEIIYHRGYVERIVAFFKPPASQLESVSALVDVASETLDGIRKESRAGLEYALQTHSTVDIRLDMNAPIIVVPEDVTKEICQHIVLDAGHISIESGLADKSAIEDIRSKQKEVYTDDDFHKLESLMYDKFFIKLDSAQLLMGDTLEACLGALEGHAGPELHVLERINLSFTAENSILSKAPNLTRFKVSGHLPDLTVNFSDRKYKILMRMIDVAVPKFGEDEPEPEHVKPNIGPRKPTQTFISAPMYFSNKEVDHELHLDGEHHEQEEEQKEDAGKDDVFYDTQDTGEGGASYKQKTFELSFVVDKLQAAIYKSDPKQVESDKLLVKTVLEGFDLMFSLRPYDMEVDITLRALHVDDAMVEEGTVFQHLITSERPGQNGQSASEDLVHIKYSQVQPDSPEFMTVHEAFNKSVEIQFATINVIVTRASILLLFDFVMSTFASGDESASDPDTPSTEEATLVQVGEPIVEKLRVKVKLTSVVLILNDDGVRLATLSLSAADVMVLLRGATIRVAARLGSLDFVDDLEHAGVPLNSPARKMLTIDGEELADLQYETLDPADDERPYDTLIRLKTGSLRFTFLEVPVHRVLRFLTKFARMKSLYDRATQAAAQQAATELESRLHYDISIASPIIVFPRSSHSKDRIIAQLGTIEATNEFSTSTDGKLITKIRAALKSVALTSEIQHDGQLNTLPILEKLDLSVSIQQASGIDHTQQTIEPDTRINARMSDVKIGLTQAQYGFAMSLSQSIPRALASTQEELDEDAEEEAAHPMPAPPITNGETSPDENKETVDLLPELSSIAHGQNGEIVRLWISLELSFAVQSVGLELYTAAAIDPATLDSASLARFALTGTKLSFKSLNNGSSEAELSLSKFTLHDTRTAVQTKWREIIPASKHESAQFMVAYSAAGGKDPIAIANITIDSPTLVFSVDPLFALLNYFTSAFDSAAPAVKSAETKADEAEEENEEIQPAQSVSALSYRVNLVQPKIMLLADPNRHDSEAVVLTIDRLQMAQQGTLVLTIDQLGMFLCKMDAQSNTLRFLDSFDLSLSLDTREDAGRQLTNIEMRVQPLTFRLSFRDVKIIMLIVNRAIELSGEASPAPADAVEMPAKDRSTERRASVTEARPGLPKRATSERAVKAGLVMSKETLRATCEGFQLVLIGDMHELPMLDVKAGKFSAKASDWSADLKASLTIDTFINYYNLRNSHWEPLLDPWEFTISVSRSQAQESTALALTSKKRAEVNITATFIELGLTTMAILEQQGESVMRMKRGQNAPFEIRNRTGYPIMLAAESDHKQRRKPAQRLEDGASMPWRFDDWRVMRENVNSSSHNSLSVQIEGTAWERLRHINVDREGEQIHALRPKVDNTTHRVMCDIKLQDNVKIVTFRSAFRIQNMTLVPVEMVIVDSTGKKASSVYKIPPGEYCPVPIEAAYNQKLRIRPDPGFGYLWSSESFDWQDLVKRPSRAIVCKSQEKEASFRFQCFTEYDRNDPLIRVYPRLTLKLRAPIEIENLLPYDIRYRVYDKAREHNWTSFLRKGGVSPMHIAELSHLLLLSVELQDTDFKRSEFAIINTDNPDDLPIEEVLQLEDSAGLKLNLRVNYERHPDSGGAFKVQVYSPYIFINNTGSDFTIATKSLMGTAKGVVGNGEGSPGTSGTVEKPLLFSYATVDRRNRALLRFGHSAWSKPLSFEAIGTESEVSVPSHDGKEEMRIGLKVTEGTGSYKLTKVVIVYPRFILKNNYRRSIRVREAGSTNSILVQPDVMCPLKWWRTNQEPLLSVAYDETSSAWCSPFKVKDIGRVHSRMKTQSGQESLLRAEILLEGSKIFIRVAEEKDKWPFVVRNSSKYPFSVSQSQEDFRDRQEARKLPPAKSYRVEPGQTLQYAWDVPSASDKLLRLEISGKDRLLNIMEIGALLPFRFPISNRSHAVVSLDVKAEGPTQALIISDYAEQDSVYTQQVRPGSLSRQNSTTSVNQVDFEARDVQVRTTLTVKIQMEGLGISLVNRSMSELLYASFRGFELNYSDSSTNQAVNLSVKWIQIDNQLFGGVFPILLYPAVIPKDGRELELRPSFQASVILLKDSEHGVTYFKYASLLLQEMSIEVDEDFLFALLDFSKLEGASWQKDPPSILTDESGTLAEPAEVAGAGDVYFESLHLQPMQLDISFMRTETVNSEQKVFASNRNPVTFFLNALTMALGNVNDAPIRLNALMIENVRISYPELANRVVLHYSQDFFGQLYRVLGSADFLGNPIGLFNNVSSGVKDIFYQPYEGLVMHGNRDIGLGIARGAGSFVKKTVFGVTDSMAKVTGSIGKGLSAATLDKEWQSKRRMRQFRNKPKHALYGFTAAGNSFFTSVASGIEGLAMKPIEGADAGGAAGFFKGVGKGLVGAVTKPVVGVFDAANNFTEGIRNTTTVFDDSAIDRVRLPRYVASDDVLRPFQEREALGQSWLKSLDNGAYFSERYVAHVDIPNDGDDLLVVLTETQILLVRALKLKVGWAVPLSDLQTISLEPKGIALTLRRGATGPFLNLPDQSARLWFFKHIERVVRNYNSQRKTYTE